MAVVARTPRLPYHWINSGDQGRYLSLAENIARGNWTWSNEYDIVGSNVSGFTLYQPPLYPLLTGLVTVMTREVQIAGTAVSLVAGLLAALFTMLLALRIAGPTVSLLAGSAMAWHPLMVNFSTNRYTEMTYTAALIGSLLALCRALERPTARRLMVLGLAWGITALARFEGQNFFLLALLFLAIRVGPRRAALTLGLFLAAVMPFKIWGTLATPDDPPQIDQVTHTLVTIRGGGELDLTPYVIDPHGVVTTREAAAETSTIRLALREWRFFLGVIRENVGPTADLMRREILWGGQWIAALIGALLILILDDRRCDRRFLVVLSVIPILLYSVSHPLARYFISVAPLHLMLMAVTLAVATHAILRSPGLRDRGRATAAVTLVLMLLLSITYGIARFGSRDYYDIRERARSVQRVWVMAHLLRSLPDPPETVAARDPAFGWLCGARQVIFPCGDRDATLRFLRDEGAEYLLVEVPRTRVRRPIQREFIDPAQLLEDLELIASDPGNWYYLYRVRSRREVEPVLPGNPVMTYMQALLDFDLLDFHREECRALSPRDSSAMVQDHLHTALASRSRGDLNEALAILDEALDLIPSAWLAYGMRADLLEEMGRPEDAIRDWAVAISIADGEGREDLWSVARGHLRAMGISLAEALARADATAWRCHEIALTLQRDHPEEALEIWNEGLRVGPPNAEYQLGRHRCLMRLGRAGEALEAARSAQRLSPDHVWASLYIGDALQALALHEEARRQWLSTLRMRGSDVIEEMVRQRLERLERTASEELSVESTLAGAEHLLAQGDMTAAAERVEGILESHPLHGAAHRIRAMALDQLGGREEEALQSWIMAVCHIRGAEAEATWEEGLAHLERRRESLPEALRQGGADAWQCHRMAQWLQREQRWDIALQVWEIAVELGPPHEEFHLGRHRCLMNLASPEGALAAAEEALVLNADHPWAWLYLGDAQAAMGRTEEAQVHWQRVLDSENTAGVHAIAAERLGANRTQSTP
jgi:tetratricopeptide (TPR) repeat protein